MAPPRPGAGAGRALLGFGLLLPAGLALLLGYVVPTVVTIYLSFTDYSVFGSAQWTGVDNYTRLVEDDRRLGVGFALLLALVPLLVLLLVAPLLAWSADRAGRPMRLVTRIALSLPMVCIAPAALAAAWAADRNPRLLVPDPGDRFADPLTAQWTLGAMLWISLFGLICAIGVTVYLSAFRGRGSGRSAWPAVLTVGGFATLAAVAVALQSFTYPYTITAGGPMEATTTPMLTTFSSAFQEWNMGYGSARVMVVLLPVMFLGIGATVLLLLTRLRVEMAAQVPGPAAGDMAPPRWDGVRVIALVIAALGLIVVLAIAAYGLWPWLSGLGRTGPDLGASKTASLVVNTWLAPLVSTVVGVGLAALAGFGIGALRPLGRSSELLLLPFAPWLFIGVGPLFVTQYVFAQEVGVLDSFLANIPPVWLVVPALVLFTLLFRGLESQRRARAAIGPDPGVGRLLLWSLPMLVLVGAATWLVQAQSLLWPLLVGVNPDRWSGPVLAVQQLYRYSAAPGDLGYALVLPIPAIVIFALLLGLLQVFYLDKLAIRVGRDDTHQPPR